MAEEFEQDVSDRVLSRIRSDRVPPASPPPVAALETRLADLEARLAEAAADYYGTRSITRQQFTAASDSLMVQIGKVKGELGKAERQRPVDVRGIAERWERASLLDRRFVLEQVCESIVVEPGQGRNVYHPPRVRVVWR